LTYPSCFVRSDIENSALFDPITGEKKN